MKLNLKQKKEKIIFSIIIGIMSCLLISCMFVQFKTINKSQETDLESLRADELSTQIAS